MNSASPLALRLGPRARGHSLVAPWRSRYTARSRLRPVPSGDFEAAYGGPVTILLWPRRRRRPRAAPSRPRTTTPRRASFTSRAQAAAMRRPALSLGRPGCLSRRCRRRHRPCWCAATTAMQFCNRKEHRRSTRQLLTRARDLAIHLVPTRGALDFLLLRKRKAGLRSEWDPVRVRSALNRVYPPAATTVRHQSPFPATLSSQVLAVQQSILPRLNEIVTQCNDIIMASIAKHARHSLVATGTFSRWAPSLKWGATASLTDLHRPRASLQARPVRDMCIALGGAGITPSRVLVRPETTFDTARLPPLGRPVGSDKSDLRRPAAALVRPPPRTRRRSSKRRTAGLAWSAPCSSSSGPPTLCASLR